MHPSFTDHMSTKRMEQFQREALVMQRVNHAKIGTDSTTGNRSISRFLWYLFFGLHIPTSSQKQGETFPLQSFRAYINAIMWMIGCVALGLGLLIGSFINTNFGMLPIVLLCSVLLAAVSFTILKRSATALSKHTKIPSH